jgi:hypothetical protein
MLELNEDFEVFIRRDLILDHTNNEIGYAFRVVSEWFIEGVENVDHGGFKSLAEILDLADINQTSHESVKKESL